MIIFASVMDEILKDITSQEYKEGFVTDVEQEFAPKGLNEDIIRHISERKQEPEWLLEFRLDAFRRWQKMKEPGWGHLKLPKIDYQDIIYWAAPKKDSERPTEIDPALLETFDKLGIPLEQEDGAMGGALVLMAVIGIPLVACLRLLLIFCVALTVPETVQLSIRLPDSA